MKANKKFFKNSMKDKCEISQESRKKVKKIGEKGWPVSSVG